jgi:hypothetical protein
MKFGQQEADAQDTQARQQPRHSGCNRPYVSAAASVLRLYAVDRTRVYTYVLCTT